MGAEAFVVYYGVCFPVEDEAEIETLEYSLINSGDDGRPIHETNTALWHPKVLAAVREGLQWTWGKTQAESYYLLIGKELGLLGWEYAGDVAIPTQELEEAIVETKRRLDAAGFQEPVALHAHHEPDF